MRHLKLSATLILMSIALASAIPMIAVGALGPSPEVYGLSLLASTAVIAGAALLVEPASAPRLHLHKQLGEVGDIEAEYKKVRADLKEVNDSLKTYAEQSQRELKTHAALSEETKAKVDQLLIQQGELKAQLQAAEQVIAKIEAGGGEAGREKTLGEQVIENEAIKAFNPGMQGQVSIKVGSIHAAITTGDSSAGPLIQPQRLPGILMPPQQRLFLRDLLPWGRATGGEIEYVRELLFTNNADVVSENPTNPKPESDITFEPDSAKIATIAHWIRASKQVLADVAQLQAYIDGRLRYGLKLKEEAQLLKGSGVGLNINGLYTQASNYTNPGVTVQNETSIDRLRIAMLQVTLAEYEADGIVLSPIDWTTIELTKTTDDAYLFATPRGLATPGLWGRPVVPTQAMDAGDFLVGAFSMGAMGWDREDANVTVSNQDRDNFVKNMVTILCEERVGLTVFRPQAFVKGELAVS